MRKAWVAFALPLILSACALAEPGAGMPKVHDGEGEVLYYIRDDALGRTELRSPDGTRAYLVR